MRHTITGDELEALDALKDWVRSWRESGGPMERDTHGKFWGQMVEAGKRMLDIEERDEELRLAECRAEDSIDAYDREYTGMLARLGGTRWEE